MQRIIVLTVVLMTFIPSLARAQYWDWVTDERSMAAFTEQYLTGQLVELGKYLAFTELVKKEQQEIAEKVRFIHMVRDSLFKSLQDVKGIQNSLDEKIIYNVYGQVEAYYTQISVLSKKHNEFKDTWTQYDNYVVSHSKDLLKITEMAVKGHDEKNLLDKEQRLFILSFVLYELKGLREMSKRTLHELEVGNVEKEYPIPVLMEKTDALYKK
jgi:hypothetical protein